MKYTYGAGSISNGNDFLVFDSVGHRPTFGYAIAGSTYYAIVQNSDNTNANSHSKIEAQVGGASGGDPYLNLAVGTTTAWSLGVDNTASDQFKINTDSSGDVTPSGGTNLMLMGTNGSTTWTGQNDGGNNLYRFIHAYNTAGSSICVDARAAGGTGDDAWFRTSVDGVLDWSFGVDNDDSDKWKISKNVTLGTNDYFSMTTAGECTMPLQPAFLAYLGTIDTNATGNGTTYTLGSSGTALTEVYDQNSDFNTNGTFTAPVTGRYYLQFAVRTNASTSATSIDLQIVTSNRTYRLNENTSSLGSHARNLSVIADMDASHTATFTISLNGIGADTAGIVGSATLDTYVSGYLVC